jgi:hypothetical protein
MQADYDALKTAIGNTSSRTRTLSAESVCVLFVALDFIRFRSSWVQSNGDALTDAQWDELNDWISDAQDALY